MIRIVTDSGANLPPAIVAKYNIAIVPLRVHIGDQSYREGIEISQERFYQQLVDADPLPKTSQPSPAEFEEVYREILEQGDEIVSIHLTSKLSGTYNSARNAMLALDETRMSVIDSKSASVGMGLLVLAAARLAEAGRSREEIVSRVETLADDVLLVFTPETLEYLRKGGRIGAAQAFLGGLLRVKPIIMLQDGVVEPSGRARSRGKAIEQLVQMEVDRFGDRPVWVGIAQAMAEDVDQLEELARERLKIQELIRAEISPVIATHAGPGVLGIAVLPAPVVE
ncbi:MAG: DegV family protein [Chloroflexota bacterium]|nr:DegV family protein [Chloroflexota bacterium]